MWIQEFVEKLASKDVESAQLIKFRNLPSSLYKYRSLNPHSIDNFQNDTLWVSSADEFNDKYDCFYTLSHEKLMPMIWSKEEKNIKRFFLSLCEKHKHSVSESEIQNASSLEELAQLLLVKDKNIPSENHEEMIDDLKDAQKNILQNHQTGRLRNIIQKNMGICSLSEINSSMIMWRYYGDNHKGFCLEYDLDAIKDFNTKILHSLFPVVYTENLPDMTSYFLSEENQLNSLFGIIAAMHKSKEWGFEREWRIIAPLGKKDCSFLLKVPKPKAIYLGIEIEAGDRKTLLNIAKRKDVETFQMDYCSQSYQLRALQIEG